MTNANNAHAATDATFARSSRRWMPTKPKEIREAYYKAIEGLMTLSEALEIADAQQTPSAGPLLTEHFNAVQALDAMKNSRLGKIL